MGRGTFLDKDAVRDLSGDYYFLITNVAPPGYLFAYRKYTYTGRGLWRGYERVLPKYGVHNLASSPQEFRWEPCYGASFPVLMRSRVRDHMRPEDAFDRLLRNERKSHLSGILFSLLEGLPSLKLGVTGSILLGIEHSDSDLDLVVYGRKGAEDFMAQFTGREPDPQWIVETSENYNLPLDAVKSIYDRRVRGVHRGVRYSFLFVREGVEKYCEQVCESRGEVRTSGELEGDVEALFYPSRALMGGYTVISYEGIFSTVMYGRRRVKVRGVLMSCDGERRVVIGAREVRGYVLPV
jgi:predicted nucleotidyltransferase